MSKNRLIRFIMIYFQVALKEMVRRENSQEKLIRKCKESR